MTVENGVEAIVEQLEEGDRPIGLDGVPLDRFASHDYVNPEFFTPKEISSLAISLSVQILPLIVKRGKMSIKDIKTAINLATIIIALSLDDRSQQLSFEKATKLCGLQKDVLLDSRRRLGEAMRSGEVSDEPMP